MALSGSEHVLNDFTYIEEEEEEYIVVEEEEDEEEEEETVAEIFTYIDYFLTYKGEEGNSRSYIEDAECYWREGVSLANLDAAMSDDDVKEILSKEWTYTTPNGLNVVVCFKHGNFIIFPVDDRLHAIGTLTDVIIKRGFTTTDKILRSHNDGYGERDMTYCGECEAADEDVLHDGCNLHHERDIDHAWNEITGTCMLY